MRQRGGSMNEAYKVLLCLVTTLSLRHTHLPSLLIFYSLSYFYPSLLVSSFPRFCYLNRLLSLLPSLHPPPFLSFLSRFSSLSLALVCSPKMTASFPFCLCFNFLWPSPIPTPSPLTRWQPAPLDLVEFACATTSEQSSWMCHIVCLLWIGVILTFLMYVCWDKLPGLYGPWHKRCWMKLNFFWDMVNQTLSGRVWRITWISFISLILVTFIWHLCSSNCFLFICFILNIYFNFNLIIISGILRFTFFLIL